VSIFNEWLKWFDKNLRGESRTIILLLDNASVHKIFSGNEPTNIKIRFLPPNTTSALQPCDAGIIHSFKSQYRKLFVRHKLQLLEERLENCDNFEEYNIKHAIYNVFDAWNNVDRNTIRNCWLKTGILPTSYHTTIINRAAEELAVETNEQSTIIQELINRMNLPDPLDASGNVNHLQYFPIFVRINVTNAV
jgi:hypothetical protein